MPLCRDKCHATAITIVPWRNLVIFFIPVHVRKHSNFLCCWHENRSSLTNNYELHVEHKGLSFSEVWVFETLGVGVCLLCSPLLGCRATPPFKCGLMSDFPWQLHFRCCWQKPRLHACLPTLLFRLLSYIFAKIRDIWHSKFSRWSKDCKKKGTSFFV